MENILDRSSGRRGCFEARPAMKNKAVGIRVYIGFRFRAQGLDESRVYRQ